MISFLSWIWQQFTFWHVGWWVSVAATLGLAWAYHDLTGVHRFMVRTVLTAVVASATTLALAFVVLAVQLAPSAGAATARQAPPPSPPVQANDRAAQLQANYASVISTDVTADVLGAPIILGGDDTQAEVLGMSPKVSITGYYGYPHSDWVMGYQDNQFGVMAGSYGTDYVNGVATPGAQLQQMPNLANGDYVWQAGGMVDGDSMWIFGEEVHGLDTVTGEVMAQFSWPGLAYEGMTTWSTGNAVAAGWSTVVQVPGGFDLAGMVNSTCIYATDCQGAVAYIPSGDETQPDAWTLTTGLFAASDGLGNEITVTPDDSGGYLAYGQTCDVCTTGSAIEELSAPAVTGPWTPTGRSWPTQAGPMTYGVQAHPAMSDPGTLMLTYDRNGDGVYDPAFLAISLPLTQRRPHPHATSHAAQAQLASRSGTRSHPAERL